MFFYGRASPENREKCLSIYQAPLKYGRLEAATRRVL